MSAAQCLSTGAGIRISGTGTKSGTLALRDGGTKGWWHPEMVASRDGGTQGAKFASLVHSWVCACWSEIPQPQWEPSQNWEAAHGYGQELQGKHLDPEVVALHPELSCCPGPRSLKRNQKKKSEKLISFPGPIRKRNQFFCSKEPAVSLRCCCLCSTVWKCNE